MTDARSAEDSSPDDSSVVIDTVARPGMTRGWFLVTRQGPRWSVPGTAAGDDSGGAIATARLRTQRRRRMRYCDGNGAGAYKVP
jgi:hypothetical protein